MKDTERLRFAPSPTGDLHVGGARVALFNWLYARKTGGKFLLRIEDTDVERSSGSALESILESLRWLGLSWDEEPVFQSQRSDLYRAAVEKLLASGAAYRCFCTKEKLDAESEKARREKLKYHYTGTCRWLDDATVARNLAMGKPFTIRFRIPGGESAFDDLVHGVTTFQNETIGDFIIARADGSPMYILGVAVDDADMGITLVMRGDDHISNTPKQMMLMSALGSVIPRFAHLPQVLGADKKKLSKRHGAASVIEYRRMGFLPESVVNFLALLGWNPGDDRERMTLDELIEAFSIEGISKKSSVFDIQKLEWLNGQYFINLPAEQLFPTVGRVLVKRGLVAAGELEGSREYILAVIRQLQKRCRLVGDFADQGAFYFTDPTDYEEKGVMKYFGDIGTAVLLDRAAERFGVLGDFSEAALDETVRTLAEDLGLGAAKLIHPIRLAVTGLTYGPGLFELMHLIGKDRVLARLWRAAEYIRKRVKEMDIEDKKVFFNLLKELIKYAEENLKLIKFDKKRGQHLASVCLYCRIIELCYACVYLVEKHISIGVPLLVRSGLEAQVDLVNCLNDIDYFKIMYASYLIPKKKYLSNIGDNVELSATEYEFNNLKGIGINPLNVKERFEKAIMLQEYYTAYNLLCLDTHNTIRSLEDYYIEKHNGEYDVTLFKDLYPHEEIISILTILLNSSELIHDFFKTRISFNELSKRFNVLIKHLME